MINKKIVITLLFLFTLISLNGQYLDSYRIVSGSYLDITTARNLELTLRNIGFRTQLEKAQVNNNIFYRVLVGEPFLTRDDAFKCAELWGITNFWVVPPHLRGTLISELLPIKQDYNTSNLIANIPYTKNNNLYKQITDNPEIPVGGVRIVLTWDDYPYDLDAHLLVPNGSHVYYGQRNPTGAGARLDTDSKKPFGEETISITKLVPGIYRYFVNNYPRNYLISESRANVKIYDSTGIVFDVDIPIDGIGNIWDVFEFDGVNLTLNNTIIRY